MAMSKDAYRPLSDKFILRFGFSPSKAYAIAGKWMWLGGDLPNESEKISFTINHHLKAVYQPHDRPVIRLVLPGFPLLEYPLGHEPLFKPESHHPFTLLSLMETDAKTYQYRFQPVDAFLETDFPPSLSCGYSTALVIVFAMLLMPDFATLSFLEKLQRIHRLEKKWMPLTFHPQDAHILLLPGWHRLHASGIQTLPNAWLKPIVFDVFVPPTKTFLPPINWDIPELLKPFLHDHPFTSLHQMDRLWIDENQGQLTDRYGEKLVLALRYFWDEQRRITQVISALEKQEIPLMLQKLLERERQRNRLHYGLKEPMRLDTLERKRKILQEATPQMVWMDHSKNNKDIFVGVGEKSHNGITLRQLHHRFPPRSFIDFELTSQTHKITNL